VHAIALLTAAAALAASAFPADSTLMVDPKGNIIDVLYTFNGENDSGQAFVGVTADKSGNLYGAAAGQTGGCDTFGTVYELTASSKFKALHQFNGNDGQYPVGTVIRDKAGNLYGTASGGGSHNLGIVYKISANGTFSTLHAFTGGTTDGGTPESGIVMDENGNLYGTTWEGGSGSCSQGLPGCGTVYKIAPDGTETVLYSFTGGADGGAPRATLAVDASGDLYGTTYWGGDPGCSSGGGCGVVFKVAPNGKETTLYTFTGGNDGGNPYAGVIVDGAGNLYGTASVAGAYGYGTIFKVAGDGTESTLYTFQGNADGAMPLDPLIMNKSGNLYGTTYLGGVDGAHGFGVVFKLSPNGVEKPLYQFQNRGDGWNPFGGLTLYKGYLYGTAAYGGNKNDCGTPNGFGTIFKVKS
jgi:uncharacterized repeat protein (TIGR03803 family)